MSMVMGPGQLGAVYMWVRGTTGQWGLGSQGSGHYCQRGRGEWGIWGPLRGGQREGFLRDYGAFACWLRECGVCSWPGVDRAVLAPALDVMVVSLDASGIF